ncbi:MAG TPA: sugar ABC transporter ATP-binding protein, partial [Nitrospiraceae bacterium]|nr:sugar ABC transporter ATP-binding protein [Nitrospiraceae bacterium]
SGGQRQRVALGRAIIRKPKVFLMDEPLSNLDARLRVDMRAQLKKLHQELKITTVYVTHDQAEALSLSERIAVLNRGEIQHLGTPQDVYLKPATLFVGGFIGSPPMNFLSGTIRKAQPLEIDCNGITLSPALETMPVGTVVTIGIRPENITVSNKNSGGDIEITVSIVEPAGSFNWVDAEWNGVPMKGTANLEAVLKPGDAAYMSFPAEKIVVFDAASEKRL